METIHTQVGADVSLEVGAVATFVDAMRALKGLLVGMDLFVACQITHFRESFTARVAFVRTFACLCVGR